MIYKKIMYVGCVSVVVMIQASEKKPVTIKNVDQLRREIRNERNRFNQDGGRSYVDNLTRSKRVNFEPADAKKVDNQTKENI